jgi:hypothetical protein
VESPRARVEAHLESIRRRLLESVPELSTFLADFCREVRVGEDVLELRVGDYKLALVDPVVCAVGRATAYVRDVLTVSLQPEATRRFLWFRAVEVRDARSLGRLQSRFAKLVYKVMELYAKPPDFNAMLSEVCGSLVLEPSETVGSLKLLEYEVPFGRASVYVNNATYSCKAEGATLRIVLKGVVSASVDSYARPVGFRGFEVHEQT